MLTSSLCICIKTTTAPAKALVCDSVEPSFAVRSTNLKYLFHKLCCKYPSLGRGPATGLSEMFVEFIIQIIFENIFHLDIVWVIGRKLQLSSFSESGNPLLVCQKSFWLAHHCMSAWSANCKLQLHRIPGQFVVVQHIYIASINFPRPSTAGIKSPKWTSGLLAVSELFHLFIISALFVGLWLQHSWSWHLDVQHNILMKNTDHIPRGGCIFAK